MQYHFFAFHVIALKDWEKVYLFLNFQLTHWIKKKKVVPEEPLQLSTK